MMAGLACAYFIAVYETIPYSYRGTIFDNLDYWTDYKQRPEALSRIFSKLRRI